MKTEWEKNVIVPMYKHKSGTYRGTKLLEQLMKRLERILEQRLRELIEIDETQLGFIKEKRTTGVMIVVKQM